MIPLQPPVFLLFLLLPSSTLTAPPAVSAVPAVSLPPSLPRHSHSVRVGDKATRTDGYTSEGGGHAGRERRPRYPERTGVCKTYINNINNML